MKLPSHKTLDFFGVPLGSLQECACGLQHDPGTVARMMNDEQVGDALNVSIPDTQCMVCMV